MFFKKFLKRIGRRGQIRTAVKGFADHHLSTRSPDSKNNGNHPGFRY